MIKINNRFKKNECKRNFHSSLFISLLLKLKNVKSIIKQVISKRINLIYSDNLLSPCFNKENVFVDTFKRYKLKVYLVKFNINSLENKFFKKNTELNLAFQ